MEGLRTDVRRRDLEERKRRRGRVNCSPARQQPRRSMRRHAMKEGCIKRTYQSLPASPSPSRRSLAGDSPVHYSSLQELLEKQKTQEP